ncbi:MAG: flagellin, partial [Bdellovibrionota bacterium]
LEIQVGLNNDPFNDRFVFDGKGLQVDLQALGLGNISTETKVQAQENLTMLDGAITQINESRANLGALQNRLQSTINNLGIYRENLSEANSRIRDTDMAEESSELVRNNILTSSTIAMLGQANTNPQAALKLLS